MSINTQSSNTRIENIDLIRMTAVFSVVLCHATETIYHLNLEYMNSIPQASKVTGLFLFTVGRIGVPLFLMITGYLLLDREYDTAAIKRFYKKNWLHLLICTWIWIVVYAVFRFFCLGVQVNIEEIIKELVFIRKIPMSHAWYLPMILGMYIFIPFVSKAVQAFPLKMLVLAMTLVGFFALIYPVLDVINNVINPTEKLNDTFSLGFSGGAYGLYFVFGYLIKIKVFNSINRYIIAITALGSFVLAVYLQVWSYSNGVQYNIWYNNVFITVATLGLFELLTRLKKVHCYVFISEIAYYSFPIYLLHMMIILAFNKYVHYFPAMKSMHVLVLWIVSFGVSFGIAWLINRIPRVGKYVLYTK